MSSEKSNRWIFLCIVLSNNNISISLDKQVKLTSTLEDNQIQTLAGLKHIQLSWYNEFMHFHFAEKFTFFNIHSNAKPLVELNCGESGDLYAWDTGDWRLVNRARGSETLPPTSQESTYRICESQFQLLSLPPLYFHPALKICNSINGKMFYADNVFVELIGLEATRLGKDRHFWVPFTDEVEEGVFRNVYTNATFDNISQFWSVGQPNGGRSDSNLSWKPKVATGGLWDVSDEHDHSRKKCLK